MHVLNESFIFMGMTRSKTKKHFRDFLVFSLNFFMSISWKLLWYWCIERLRLAPFVILTWWRNWQMYSIYNLKLVCWFQKIWAPNLFFTVCKSKPNITVTPQYRTVSQCTTCTGQFSKYILVYSWALLSQTSLWQVLIYVEVSLMSRLFVFFLLYEVTCWGYITVIDTMRYDC